MELTRQEWLKARADHYRALILDIERQIELMEREEFTLHERTAENPHELDITQQMIAHERQVIAELQRVIGFIESQL
jgi:hypothetical protein